MVYELFKAVHITSVIVWIAGMAIAAVALRHPGREAMPAIRAFDRRFTTPAMLLAWVFGILLAVQGGWFGAGWLWGKLALVTALSGLHGAISGRLRRMEWMGGPTPDHATRMALPIGFGLLLAIVALVTTKVI